MPEQQLQSSRVKTETPQSSSAPAPTSRQNSAGWLLRVIGIAVVVIAVCLVGARRLLRSIPSDSRSAVPVPQIDVPSPADPNAALPRASETEPVISTVSELAKPWASKGFFFQKRQTGENVPALLVRLPTGSAEKSAGYWAFSMKAPANNCDLEYLPDLKKLSNDYEFRSATHPMVGNPCSRTVFDPLKIMSLPGNVWVRGAIVQGSDLRPPLGIEVRIVGKEILAVRME